MLGSLLAHWTAARLASNAGVPYQSSFAALEGTTFGLEGFAGTSATIAMAVVKVAIGKLYLAPQTWQTMCDQPLTGFFFRVFLGGCVQD